MKTNRIITFIACFSLVISACKKDDKGNPEPTKVNTVPEFYSETFENDYGKNSPKLILIANSATKIDKPQDLDFNPQRPYELWIINKGTESTGGSTVMITDAGTQNQQYDYRKDGNAWHFMSLPSALSFSKNGDWATSPNVLDANHNGGSFTGPSLWSGDLNVYAKPSGGNGSHLDMLHGSPLSMGIENERDNVYWVFDGYNKHICRYNFNNDHGAGNDDHSDGTIHRYTEISVKRNPAVPSHLVLDKDKKWLYIVDGGNKRILRMDITTGTKLKDLPLKNEQLSQYWEINGVKYEEIIPASFGLKQPCGIEINGNRLFISDFETGEIICFDIESRKELARFNTGKVGIMGIKIDADNKLWYVNAVANEVVKLEPR